MMHKDDCENTFVRIHSNQENVRTRRINLSKNATRVGAGFAVFFFASISINFSQSYFVRLSNRISNFKNKTSNSETEFSDVNLNSNFAANNAHVFGEGGPESIEFSAKGESELGFNDSENFDQADRFVPNIYPLSGKINNGFGWRRNPFGGAASEFHAGMDIDGETGAVVIAPANGTVVKAGWQGGYGNLIEIDHGNAITTRYGHLSRVAVEAGQTIERGAEIGKVGSTGRSTGPHLHYEVRLNNRAVNPRKFLPVETIPAE